MGFTSCVHVQFDVHSLGKLLIITERKFHNFWEEGIYHTVHVNAKKIKQTTLNCLKISIKRTSAVDITPLRGGWCTTDALYSYS